LLAVCAREFAGPRFFVVVVVVVVVVVALYNKF
jgi:hypothetical protein